MRPTPRYRLLTLWPLLFTIAVMVGASFLRFRSFWFVVGAFALALAVAIGYQWWLSSANKWTSYQPAENETFEPEPAELPVVSDHPNVFWTTTARNLVSSPGWQAFEVLDKGKRTWFFTVPLTRSYSDTHLVPTRPLFSKPTAVSQRYGIESRTPDELVRALKDQPDFDSELWVEDDLLAVSEFAMTPAYFRRWLTTRGLQVLEIADEMDRQRASDETQDQLDAGDPSRNEWRPDAVDEAEEPEGWQQPPRQA